MRTFNAVQIVVLVLILPFIIGWLYKGPFPYSHGVLWIAITLEVVGFCVLVAGVRELIDDWYAN